jgi:hypothetical protein
VTATRGTADKASNEVMRGNQGYVSGGFEAVREAFAENFVASLAFD